MATGAASRQPRAMPAADSTAPSATMVFRSRRDSSRSSSTGSDRASCPPQKGQARSCVRTCRLQFPHGFKRPATPSTLARDYPLLAADLIVVERQVVEPHHEGSGRHLVKLRTDDDRRVARHFRVILAREADLLDLAR